METKVKATATGIHPKTGEIHHLDFEGDAVCIVTINDKDDGISATDALMGSVDLDRALGMVKALAGAARHLLDSLPPALSTIITGEMMREMLGKMGDDEQQALKDYDARRAADELA